MHIHFGSMWCVSMGTSLFFKISCDTQMNNDDDDIFFLLSEVNQKFYAITAIQE